jgi:hypothetical protein
METKYIVDLCAALIPLVIGFIWYHPKVLGSVIKAANGVTGENANAGHKPWVYLLTYVVSYFIARSLGSVVIHQYGLLSFLANEPDVHVAGTPLNITVQGLLDKYGDNYRTFKHGAYHGYQMGLYLVAPIIAIITLFEKRKWTWLLVHAGYWIVCLALMGGVVCAYMPMHIQAAR